MSNFNNLVIPTCTEYAQYLLIEYMHGGVSDDSYQLFMEARKRQIRIHNDRQGLL